MQNFAGPILTNKKSLITLQQSYINLVGPPSKSYYNNNNNNNNNNDNNKGLYQ